MVDFDQEQTDLLVGTSPDNIIDWVETFLTIPSEQGKVGDFKLYPQQKRMVYESTGRDLTVKGRQTRASSIIIAKNLRRMVTEEGLTCLTMTQDDQTTATFRTRIKHHLDDLERHGMPFTLSLDNDEEMHIKETGSRYMFGSGNEKVAGRAYACHIAHLSEFAHWPQEKAHSLIGGITPAVPGSPYGQMDIESTPNGAEGQFYDEIMGSKMYDPDSRWTTHFYEWFGEPRYRAGTLPSCDIQMGEREWEEALVRFQPTPDEERLMEVFRLDAGQIIWRRIRKKEQDKTDAPFLQEYPETIEGCFLTAGGSFFASPDGVNHLEQYRKSTRPAAKVLESIMWRGGSVSFFGPNLHIWQEPQPGQPYVVWVDNAGGGLDEEADFSALMVCNVASAPFEVARVNIKVAPEELAPLAVALAAYYNDALLGGERDHYGESCLRKIEELGYRNLWYYQDPNKPVKANSAPVEPWSHPNQTRNDILQSLRAFIFDHTFGTFDSLLVQQMGSFTWAKHGIRRSLKASAEKGKKDDQVMCAAGCCYIALLGRARYNAQLVSKKSEVVVVGDRGLVVSRERGGSVSTYPWLR